MAWLQWYKDPVEDAGAAWMVVSVVQVLQADWTHFRP